jgi:hypothetical protein
MGFIWSVGALTLICLGVYALLRYQSNAEDEEQIRSKILQKSDAAYYLVSQYNKSVDEGNPLMSKKKLERKLKEISKSTKERKKYFENIKRENELKEESIKEYAQDMIDNRIFGYKYDSDIFKIFDTNREMSNAELVSNVQSHFDLTKDDAQDLINSWRNNDLINRCIWHKSKWEVGDILIKEKFKIGANDLTRGKWLILENKELKEKSEKYKRYFSSNDF